MDDYITEMAREKLSQEFSNCSDYMMSMGCFSRSEPKDTKGSFNLGKIYGEIERLKNERI